MKKYLLGICLCIVFYSNGYSQTDAVTAWSYSLSNQTPRIGQEMDILIKVKINDGWYLYASDFDPNCGPQVTTLAITHIKGAVVIGALQSINSEPFFEEAFECTSSKFKKEALFKQRILVTSTKISIEGLIEYQLCSVGGCLSYERTMKIATHPILEKDNKDSGSTKEHLNTDSFTKTNQKTVLDSIIFNIRKAGFDDIEVIRFASEQSVDINTGNSLSELLLFMGIAFISGLLALLTPCVFPMIPMTVSFFTNSSSSRSQAIYKALFYGFCIIAIYVLFGSIIALFNGPDFANWLATNWIPNIVFFIIFIFFALSFLGMYELVLPSSVVNKVDQQADKGGIIGIFFMAFTLVLVSFSCTGPIVGSILVEAAGGQLLKPIVGMLGFSLSFAIPFTLFAIFPTSLQHLPKSGGWLNTVKVTLGLVELALALKFLSLADQAYHWGILDREVFLALWIAIFSILFIYLIGKIYFPHDSKADKIGVPRVVFSIVVLAFIIYLLPGMWGAPLKVLSGILPPSTTQDFDMNTNYTNAEKTTCINAPMYSESLHLPLGLAGYFDLREAIQCAVEQNKPIFLDFTGHGCANCRDMEARVWSDPSVLNMLKNDVVLLALYGDDKKIKIPESEQYKSAFGKKITTLGKQSSDLMFRLFKQQAQPYYVMLKVDTELSKNGKIVLRELHIPQGYDLSIQKFKLFIQNSIAGM